ncbi:hypothetical protein RFI_29770, partial [Reticulomyxa filosa]
FSVDHTNFSVDEKQEELHSENGTLYLSNDDVKFWKCVLRIGDDGKGLSLKNSIWKDAKGLTMSQKFVVEQRGGILALVFLPLHENIRFELEKKKKFENSVFNYSKPKIFCLFNSLQHIFRQVLDINMFIKH